MSEERQKGLLNRRQVLGTTAVAGAASIAGAVGGAGLATVGGGMAPAAAADSRSAPATGNRAEVKPGELDEYYVFFSSGQTGEVRIIGLPSMRELMRIPVFNRCGATAGGRPTKASKSLSMASPRRPVSG